MKRRKVFRVGGAYVAFAFVLWQAADIALPVLGMPPGRIPPVQDPRTVIIDTDAGVDDLMAIAWLLTEPGIDIEAITVGTGLARVEPGAHNVLKLLALAGRGDVPVYRGRATPLAGDRAFPDAWRDRTDALPGADLPEALRGPESRPAVDFLADRLSDATRPVDVLALGGLTNIAEAIARMGGGAPSLRRLVIMGGAVEVPGNLHEAGPNENTTAEWNFHIDAAAARQVFAAGLPIRLVPLDATNHVPLDRGIIDALNATPDAPLARAVGRLLTGVVDFMDAGNYYAWDPLAAMALVDSTIVMLQPGAIEIMTAAPEDGRTLLRPGAMPNALVAFDADAARFRRLFIEGLARSER